MPLLHLNVPDQLNIERKLLNLTWLETIKAGIASKKNPVPKAEDILPHIVTAHKSLKAAYNLLKDPQDG